MESLRELRSRLVSRRCSKPVNFSLNSRRSVRPSAFGSSARAAKTNSNPKRAIVSLSLLSDHHSALKPSRCSALAYAVRILLNPSAFMRARTGRCACHAETANFCAIPVLAADNDRSALVSVSKNRSRAAALLPLWTPNQPKIVLKIRLSNSTELLSAARLRKKPRTPLCPILAVHRQHHTFEITIISTGRHRTSPALTPLITQPERS
jgi:hypothetical protein